MTTAIATLDTSPDPSDHRDQHDDQHTHRTVHRDREGYRDPESSRFGLRLDRRHRRSAARDRSIAATRAHQPCSGHRRHQRRSVALPRGRARRDRRRCGRTSFGTVPDARLGRAPAGKARRTGHLLRIRGALRTTIGHSGGRVGMCPQCDRIVRSMPSGRANRRFPRWLPVGATGEAVATGSRTSGLRTYG